MNAYQKMVQEFHRALDLPIGPYEAPTISRPELRAKLLEEEGQETVDAGERKDFPEYIDGLCDVLYVAYGAAVEAGIDLGECQGIYEMRKDIAFSEGPTGRSSKRVQELAFEAAKSLRDGASVERVSMALILCIQHCHFAGGDCGVDLLPFFMEVQRANMAKKDGPIREDGKRLKPPGWQPPQIATMIESIQKHGVVKIQMSTLYGKFGSP